MHVVRVALEVQWRWVECQLLFFLPLGFILQGPTVPRPLCLLLGLFANERHWRKIEKLEEGQAMVFLPLISVFLGISGNGFLGSQAKARPTAEWPYLLSLLPKLRDSSFLFLNIFYFSLFPVSLFHISIMWQPISCVKFLSFKYLEWLGFVFF